MPRENRVEKSRMHFSCQVQHLVKLEGDFFVAGADFRAILGDSRSAKCCMFSQKMRLQDGRSQVRSPKRRVRDDDFMLR